MKNLSDKYKKTVLESSVAAIATCFSVTLRDGRKLGFTTHNENLKFIDDDIVYKTASFTPTASTKSNAMNVDNMDVDLLIDNEDIKTDDLETGVWSNARIKVFRVNTLLNPLSLVDVEKITSGFFGEMKKERGIFKSEFRSLTQPLQNNVVDVTKANCNATFADNRCKVNKELHTFKATIKSVIDRKTYILENVLQNGFNGEMLTFEDELIAENDFRHGLVKFLKNGQLMEVKEFSKTEHKIELLFSVFYDVSAGDEITITRGCNKLKETCKNRFNNLNNFRGFSFIPGLNSM